MGTSKKSLARTAVLVALVVLAASVAALAQKPEYYQATALGQGTQLGQLFNVNITIDSYSTPEERQILIDAFNQGKNEALVNALSKMPARGRIAITGTLGYDVNFVRVIPTPTGKKIRMVTDRPIRFGELWRDDRSTQYSLTVIELDISDAKGQSGGVLLPECKFFISKEGELTVETYQNPWKLTNILVR